MKRYETYRTLDYVRERCADLAQQLADIEASTRIGVIDVKNMSPREIAQAIIDVTGTIAAEKEEC